MTTAREIMTLPVIDGTALVGMVSQADIARVMPDAKIGDLVDAISEGARQRMTTDINQTGTVLTCTNADCNCRLRIEEPCPHGDTYTCACGHPFEAVAAGPLTDTPA